MEWHGREAALAEPAVNERAMERYFEAARCGDVDNTGVFVGEAVGLIKDIRPAGDIVRQIVRKAEDLLRNKAHSVLTLP
jgi:nitronate monooxygenase